MNVSNDKRLRELEPENAKLRKLVAELLLEKEVRRKVMREKW